jgi:hypothetical protein
MLSLLGIFSPLTARAADPDQKMVQAAVKKGADYLVQVYRPGVQVQGGAFKLGTASLAGTAILESGVDAKNASVQGIAKIIRAEAIAERKTYNLALCIIFLDRLADPGDTALIQFLGAKLLVGQDQTNGGWAYNSGPVIPADEVIRLQTALLSDSRLTTPPKNDPKGPADPNPQDPKKDAPRENPPLNRGKLHPDAAKMLSLVGQAQAVGPNEPLQLPPDNSNTQFALLGSWCAHRHGLPIENAMKLVDKRFRATQERDGGWAYMPSYGGPALGAGPTPPMTCVGLIALALTYGATETMLRSKSAVDGKSPVKKSNKVAPSDDPLVKAGFRALAGYMAQSREDTNAQGPGVPALPNPGVPGPGGVPPIGFGPAPMIGNLKDNLYFLWSLERVGVMYGVETIGRIEWYSWGADYLLRTQLADGSWRSNFHGASGEVNTSMALLFLNRTNLTPELSKGFDTALRTKGASDPTKSTNPAATIPGDDFSRQANQLADGVIKASGSERTKIVDNLRDSKGGVYTEALKICATKLSGADQKQVREALSQRLVRMSANTLRDMFVDENREIRLAAAAACLLKADKQYVPDLITMLRDKDATVVQAAHTSLVGLTGKDFGPDSNATEADKVRIVLAWQNWWRTQKN